MIRSRISIRKENRIWDLRCQGYRYEEIARIVNCSPSSVGTAIKRVRRRPPLALDPVRRGRYRGFLDSDQVRAIRQRRLRGETHEAIARDYGLTGQAVGLIVNGHSYSDVESTSRNTYPWHFGNRLRAA